ncbi:MAG: hypothetical protein ACJ762_12560 [Solirubrobacteraceae bacterium]
MPAVVVAVVLAALYLVLDPPSADLAAQTYRVGLFDREGWLAWDNGWYGGHHLPGYSVLFPPLASLLGLHVVAALCVVAATVAFTRVESRPLPGVWFAVGMAATAVSGRLAFLLGAAVAMWGLAAMVRGRWAAAAALGAVTALASPVAALFAALIGVATRVDVHRLPAGGGDRDVRRAAAALVVAAVLVTGVLVLAFPEGGSEPFVASAFWPALAAAAAAALFTTGAVRIAVILYALLLVGAFVVDTPIGGNAARLGALAAGPLAMALVRDRRALVLLAVPLAYWTLYPPTRDWSSASGDPARAASYYAPLLDRLAAYDGPGRLEIPFTAGHWEAARAAPRVMLARGWERQLDRKVNAVFYEGELTPERYAAWLRESAVRWVALPDAPLDGSAQDEARLIRAGLPALREVWHDAHWRLFEVRNPQPLGARAIGADWFVAGAGIVRVHWTPYWAVVEGAGCVRRGADDWTVVEPRPARSEVRVAIRVTPARALSRGARCR